MENQVNDPCNLVPKVLKDELLRLARLDRHWYQWADRGDGSYEARLQHPSWITRVWENGADGFGMYATSIYLLDGPKIFRPTQEQCDAFAQIDLRITLNDYAQPYPALLVQLPKNIGPFWAVLCHHTSHMLSCLVCSDEHRDDIISTVGRTDRPMEDSLQRYDDDCTDLAAWATRAARVAINSCLALANYGATTQWLRPKEIESDRRLAREDTPRGERARDRLATAPSIVMFSQEIKLHDSVTKRHEGGDGQDGTEVRAHWRRGHWAMQPHGPHNSLRKRILRKPVLIRADKFLGNSSDTVVTYRG